MEKHGFFKIKTLRPTRGRSVCSAVPPQFVVFPFVTLRVLRGEKQRTLWLTIISLRCNGRSRDGLLASDQFSVISDQLAFFVVGSKRLQRVFPVKTSTVRLLLYQVIGLDTAFCLLDQHAYYSWMLTGIIRGGERCVKKLIHINIFILSSEQTDKNISQYQQAKKPGW